jgi:hypothetical protein
MMEQFLAHIFGDAISPERRIAVFTTPGARTRFADSIRDAVEHAAQRSETHNVYFGLGLIEGTPPGRGTARDVGAIGAVWADIDMVGGPHDGKPLPVSDDDARRLLSALPLPPSILIHSGHGLHAYWLLGGPWVFADERERGRAAALAKGWHGLVCDEGTKLGWSLENLGDLSRVLRLPGTLNHNGPEPVEVRILDCDASVRYSREQLESCLPTDKPPSRDERPAEPVGLVLCPDAEPPQDKMLEAAGQSPKFLATWQHERPDLPDQSQSGYDLSLATIAAKLGWSEQEIADLVIAGRRNSGDKPEKALRQDYMARTIARAREAAAEEPLACVDISGIAGAPQQADGPPSNAPEDPGPFPEELLETGGLLAAIVEFSTRTAYKRQPVLALGAAIALLGTVTGRKVEDPYGTRTNVYCLGICCTGGGKEYGRQVTKELLIRAGLKDLLGPEGIASHAGLVSAVAAQPAVLFQIDEIGRFFKTTGDHRRSPHLYRVIDMFMKLYSSSGTLFCGDAYSDVKRNIVIDQPHACLYGTSVPQSFYEGITAENLTDGFMSRVLVFETNDHDPPLQDGPMEEVPPAIVEKVRRWGDFRRGGNLSEEHPEPLTVDYGPGAAAVMKELERRGRAERKGKGDAVRALWTRTTEKARKLALIHACSRDPDDLVVDVESAEWAARLSEYLTRKMIFEAVEWVAENPYEASRKRLLRTIRRGGKAGLTGTELCLRSRFLKRKERAEIVESLQETGEITVITEPSGGAPRTRYVAR